MPKFSDYVNEGYSPGTKVIIKRGGKEYTRTIRKKLEKKNGQDRYELENAGIIYADDIERVVKDVKEAEHKDRVIKSITVTCPGDHKVGIWDAEFEITSTGDFLVDTSVIAQEDVKGWLEDIRQQAVALGELFYNDRCIATFDFEWKEMEDRMNAADDEEADAANLAKNGVSSDPYGA